MHPLLTLGVKGLNRHATNTFFSFLEKDLNEEMDKADSHQASMKKSEPVHSKPFKCLDEIFDKLNIACLKFPTSTQNVKL